MIALSPVALLAAPEQPLSATTDPVSQIIVGLIIVAVFTLLTLEKVHMVLVVMGAVSLIWAITYLTPYHLISFESAQQALDFNVLFLLASMMAVVGVLKRTGVFEWAVARILEKAGGDPFRVLMLLAWFTALLSALCDNVTTVIFVAPMALQMARSMKINPAAFLLPVVMASNIGGTATLIGDPPNIMIGSGAGLSFVDFLSHVSAPVVVMMFVLPWFSSRYFAKDLSATRPVPGKVVEVPPVTDPRLLRWALWISALIFAGFISHSWTGMPTSVPATIGAGALLLVQDVLYLRSHKPTAEERQHGILMVIEKEIDWPTLSFFGFLFITVGAAVTTGLIDTLAHGLDRGIQAGSSFLGLNGAGTLLFAAIMIAWVSGILSSIVNNIPFVAVMIPIIHRIAPTFAGDTTVLWWAIALGVCLGGNGTVVGASANVTVIGIAQRAGVRIGFGEFTRFGARVTAITLVVSSAYLASHVYLGGRGALILWLAIIALVVFAKLLMRIPVFGRIHVAGAR